MSDNVAVCLELDEKKALLIAGGVVQLLIEEDRKPGGANRMTQIVAVSLLGQLSDLSRAFPNEEVKEIVDTAVSTALSLSGEVMGDDFADVIEASEAAFAM